MYIKELQLFGFKSFQERTTLRFSPGLNCIVGPNGCGKSNVLDALRWVMGEQSFSVLRCARNEDLIFAGTARIPAVNYAEVRLVLATDDRPELGSEVEIKRRFFRSGESEYYLNREPCRLKDIQELFLSQDIGTRAYSIFDLHQMREIIAGNIRRMFEEAAALAKFREAKEECQRKLELTTTDLTRLEDIIAERERVVRSLQRQAGKLRAFQRLKEEEKGLRLLELHRDYQALCQEMARVRQETEALEVVAAERARRLRENEAELRQLHNRLLDGEREKEKLLTELQRRREMLREAETKLILQHQELEFLLRNAKAAEEEETRVQAEVAQLEGLFAEIVKQEEQRNERLEAMERKLARLRDEIKAQEERLLEQRVAEGNVKEKLRLLREEEQALENRLVRLEAELANTVTGAERITREREEVAGRIKGIAGEVEELARVIAGIKERQALRQEELKPVEKSREQAARRLEEIKRRLLALREEREKLEQEVAAIDARLAREELACARSVLGANRVQELLDFIQPAAGWEQACEAALYPFLDLFVAPGVTAEEIEKMGREAERWRFGFLMEAISGENEHHERRVSIGEREDDPRVLGGLEKFVGVKPGAPAALLSFIRSFVVARDRQAFVELTREFPAGMFVSPEGFAWFGDGRLVFAGPRSGRLLFAAEAEKRRARLAQVHQEIEKLSGEEVAVENQQREWTKKSEEITSELVVLEKELILVNAQRESKEGLLSELRRDEERLRDEVLRLERAGAELRANVEKTKARRAELEAELEKIGAESSGMEQAREEAEAVVKGLLKEASELLAEVSEERRQVERLDVQRTHLHQEIEEKRRRLQELAKVKEDARWRQVALGQEEKEKLAVIERLREEVQAVERELTRFSTQEIAQATEALEKNIAELRQEEERGQRLLLEERLKLAELDTKIRAVVEEAQTSYQTDITTFNPPADADFAERLEKVRHRLEVLGQVNPLAIEEYEQEKRDLDRLIFQRDDVLQAKANLERSLGEIDRHAREQFLSTYQEVRGHFQRIFKELFLEGEADLVLVNDANPLESEVAIIAKPKGKNPKRLEQLSDGEKAMLAVSLLFAFYQVKPAPFCFLDEVDAPLDDVNVNRFADYLKRLAERTQVVIITHNRATVERADALFGVTAEEPGVSKVVSVSLADYRANSSGSGGR